MSLENYRIQDYNVRIKIWKDKKTKVFIVDAVDLPLITQGDDLYEALANFIDAFNLSIQHPDFKKKVEPFKLNNQTQNVLGMELIASNVEIASNIRSKTYSYS